MKIVDEIKKKEVKGARFIRTKHFARLGQSFGSCCCTLSFWDARATTTLYVLPEHRQ